MEGNVFESLAKGDNVVVAVLSTIVIALSAVVIYQWRYTMKETVPKWIWESIIGKIDSILDLQQKTNVVIDERLKK